MGIFRRHPVREDALSAYIDGALRGDALSRVESHLETCERCRAAVEELRVVRGALRELPRDPAPRSFALRRADIEAPRPAMPSGLLRASPMLGAVATIALLAFVSLVGLDVAADPSGGDDRASGAFSPSLGAPVEERAADGAVPPDERDDGTQDVGGEPQAETTATDSALSATGEDSPTSEPVLPATGPEVDAASDEGGDGRTGLRAAEAATAAVAIVAGGTFAVAWRRRRV